MFKSVCELGLAVLCILPFTAPFATVSSGQIPQARAGIIATTLGVAQNDVVPRRLRSHRQTHCKRVASSGAGSAAPAARASSACPPKASPLDSFADFIPPLYAILRI